jgi:DoxX-like family
MEKRKMISYWIITIVLSICIFMGGLAQALLLKDVKEGFKPLGYPDYFISLIGIWKMLGVIAILVPKFGLLKEWTYAGLFFLLTGAVVSHIASNDVKPQIIAPIFLLILAISSWYLRPAGRRIVSLNQQFAA